MPHETLEPRDPAALIVAIAAQMLSRASGRQIDVATIQADIAEGAPTNPDGTLNLVHYAAWNAQQLARKADAQ